MLKRFMADESGMEMVEWSIVAVIFAIGGVALWGTLNGRIGNALTDVGNAVDAP
jgi:Flp pilus assembly pilin Flp